MLDVGYSMDRPFAPTLAVMIFQLGKRDELSGLGDLAVGT